VVVALGLLVPGRRAARLLAVLALAGVLAGLGGTTAYAVTTAARTGSIPTVGPSSAPGGFGGAGGFGAGGAGGDASSSSWVAANHTATTVGGQTVYDLSTSISS
jgi:hypothetical protein